MNRSTSPTANGAAAPAASAYAESSTLPCTSGPERLPAQRIAVVGAGMAGVTCAHTLAQAGHAVVLFDKHHSAGGRMATRASDFGSFDHGAQFFTVTDARFRKALQASAPHLIEPWNVSPVRALQTLGQALASNAGSDTKQRYVGVPGMSALLRHWAQALTAGSPAVQSHYLCKVLRIEPVHSSEADPAQRTRWQLRCSAAEAPEAVHAGFDQVLLALPAPQALALLRASALAARWVEALDAVETAPCWTLMLAFPQTEQDAAHAFGPDWHAASSDHPRVRWLARENSKPQRGTVERWTVQACPEWSLEHLEDEPERVRDKLLRGFAEVSGIRCEPVHAVAHRWRYAQTRRALGQPFLYDASAGLGLCGDWCLGHRVENAYLSGLELALAVA